MSRLQAGQENILDFVAAKESCTIREAGLKLADWFKVGQVVRGIYMDAEDDQLIVLGVATHELNEQRLVVYQRLYGDYALLVDSEENFLDWLNGSIATPGILVKEL